MESQPVIGSTLGKIWRRTGMACAAGTGVEQHSISRSIVLHLLPGALITLFYILVAPAVRRAGFPSLLAIFLAIAVVLIPCELGYLFYEAKRRNGRLSLTGVVLYRDRLPVWHVVFLVLGLFLWSGVVFALYGLLDPVIIGAFFRWVPAWFFLAEDLSVYTKPALLGTWLLGLVVNGVAGPVVEELYFRGYLLPRLSRLGGWAAFVNAVLFSLYHFFTPWQNPRRILGLLPMVYAVWWKRNVYIGIAVHCLGNLAAMLALLPLVAG
jgi:uncharacterized protein